MALIVDKPAGVSCPRFGMTGSTSSTAPTTSTALAHASSTVWRSLRRSFSRKHPILALE